MDTEIWKLIKLIKTFDAIYRVPYIWGRRKRQRVNSATEWKKCKMFCFLTVLTILLAIYCCGLFIQLMRQENLGNSGADIGGMPLLASLLCASILIIAGAFAWNMLRYPGETGMLFQQMCKLLKECRTQGYGDCESKKVINRWILFGRMCYAENFMYPPLLVVLPFVVPNIDPSYFLFKPLYLSGQGLWIPRNLLITGIRSLILTAVGVHVGIICYVVGLSFCTLVIQSVTCLRYLLNNPSILSNSIWVPYAHRRMGVVAVHWGRHVQFRRMQRYRTLSILLESINRMVWTNVMAFLGCCSVIIVVCLGASIKYFKDMPFLSWATLAVAGITAPILTAIIFTWVAKVNELSKKFVYQCGKDNLSKVQRRVAKSLPVVGVRLGPTGFFEKETLVDLAASWMNYVVTEVIYN